MRSLRTVYNAISSDPFSNRSGGIDGRPVALYMELKIGDSSLSTVSANCFTRLSGCSRGTRSSAASSSTAITSQDQLYTNAFRVFFNSLLGHDRAPFATKGL